MSWTNLAGQTLFWEYHTIPAICVSHNGKTQFYAMDMAMNLNPIPVKDWVGKLVQGLPRNGYSYSGAKVSQSNARQLDQILKGDWAEHQRILALVGRGRTNTRSAGGRLR